MDEFWFPVLAGWKHVEAVTIQQAACLLTMHDPEKFGRNSVLPSDARGMAIAIEQAVLMKKIPPFAAWRYDELSECEVPVDGSDLNPHTNLMSWTTIHVSDLADWCDSRGIDHCWSSNTVEPSVRSLDRYPLELRAAIEAFEGVSANPDAIAGRSPRSAILQWLENNKPEIGTNARERIATVANWQPGGGAPKTPGG